MAKRISIKNRLIAAVLVLIMTASMLIGTTFAWFTDSATSGGNVIQSGKLDAEMYWSDTLLDAASTEWVNADGVPVFTYDRWEPGYTEVKYIKITNEGNLAFKWRLSIEAEGEVTKLSDIIDVYYVNPCENTVASLDGLSTAGTLTGVLESHTYTGGELLPEGRVEAGHKSGHTIIAIAFHMQEGASNEYQDMSIGDGFALNLIATQYSFEGDSFGNGYDDNADWPNSVIVGGSSASVNVTTADDKVVTEETMTSSDGSVTATIPVGVAVKAGTNKLTLKVSDVANSKANISLSATEASLSIDVHIDGVAEGNTVVMPIGIKELLPVGLNMGNFRFYHVEDGNTVEMTLLSDGATPVHNNFEYDPATGDVVLYLKSFSEVALVADTVNAWEGKVAEAFAGGTGTEKDPYIIANADQFVYFGDLISNDNENYGDKYYKLVADLNFGGEDNANKGTLFYPIGYHKLGNPVAALADDDAPEFVYHEEDPDYAKNSVSAIDEAGEVAWYTYGGAFRGTFDGNGNTISNIYQNTWQLKGNYSGNYWNAAMGVFGYVNGGTVKNLTVDNFSSDGEFTPTGVVAAYAANSTFENIAITNSNPRVYNTGNGGIVGIGGNSSDPDSYKLTFTNITIDNTNKISALWGSWDVACGGLVGMFRGAGHVYMTNCHVAAQIDVYNDVCGNYQYYWYRYSGMMVGTNKNMITDANGYTVPETSKFHAENCTVHFGEWNNYYYCELVANSLASYTHDHQFSRLTEVKAVNGTTVTPLDGEAFTVPSSGRYNYVVVNGKASTENATCYHFVNGEVWAHSDAGEETVNGVTVLKEDKQHYYLPFNQLFTGYGWGVKHIPVYNGEDYAFEGITILDREVADSVVKFEGKVTELVNNKTYTLGDIFEFINNDVELVPGALTVTVTYLDENNPVSATVIYDRENWENSTIKFTGIGSVQITIQDYYFCTPTTIEVNITERQPEVKFDSKFTGDFLYRVGNQNAVTLGTLFAAKKDANIGTVSVTVENSNGNVSSNYTANISDWTKATVKFSGTGIVKVTITDDDYCTPTELVLEVIDAVNATTATSATANNVVLLEDVGFSAIEVSGGYTLYGNGFTMTCASDSYATDRNYSFVTLAGGTLDNVRIITPNFSHAIMYEKNKTENENPSYTDSNGKTRYYNIRSAVLVSATSKITNSYISGGRAAVYLTSGELTIDNSTIFGGAVANIQAETSSNLILDDVTLIQKPIKATVNNKDNTLMGLSVALMCDTSGNGAPITLKGYLHQYAWANSDYTQYVPSSSQSIVGEVLSNTDYVHSITYDDGITRDSVNLGFAYIPDGTNATNASNMADTRSDASNAPYDKVTVSKIATIYTYKNTNGTDDAVKTEPSYTANTQGNIIPTVKYEDVNENRVFNTTYDENKAQWKSTLKVDVDAGDYSFSFAKLLAQKYGTNLSYTVKTEDGTAVDKNTIITLNSAVSNVYILTITDDQIYNKNGELINISTEITYVFELLSTKTSLPAPTFTSNTLNGTPYIVVDTKGSDWNCAVPVLDGLKVKYWSKKQNKEIELDLANVVSAAGLNAGLQNGSNNSITITVADEYTLTVTTTGFKSNDNGKPVVVNGKLYFTVSSSSNYVSTNTADRTVSISYEFTDANNSESLKLSTSMTVTYATYKSKQYKYSDFCNGKLTEASSCVTPDTLVTLADGTQKEIQYVSYEDKLLVWNFYTGEYDVAPAAIIFNMGTDNFNVLSLKFEDGTVVKTINGHRFFDKTTNSYSVINEANVDFFLGHDFVKMSESGYTTTKLVGYDVTSEYTTSYSIMSAYHYNFIVEGMLSDTFHAEDAPLFDYFNVANNMTYNAEQMSADIEKYGLYTYDEFAEYLTYEQFVALNVQYMKISVGKGAFTYEGILELIDTYISK